MCLPSFIPIGSSVWPLELEQTNKQTSQVTSRISATRPLRLFALTEGNFEGISKTYDYIHETKFPAEHDGTMLIDLRSIP